MTVKTLMEYLRYPQMLQINLFLVVFLTEVMDLNSLTLSLGSPMQRARAIIGEMAKKPCKIRHLNQESRAQHQ